MGGNLSGAKRLCWLGVEVDSPEVAWLGRPLELSLDALCWERFLSGGGVLTWTVRDL